jgi:hypothetical protein
MTRAAAIFDLDGTLAVIDHRLHHVRNGKRDWDSFFAGIGDDALAQPIARILDALVDDAAILLCSGRPEKCRASTVAWLEKHEVAYDALYMRADDDHRPDHVVKSQILDGILADGYEPFLVIDDRQSVVDMWRDRGLLPPKRPTVPNAKELVSLRIDRDILDHFQEAGPGWQDRINEALRKVIGK